MKQKKTTLGVIMGNRAFFPDHLCKEGRRTILSVLKEEGFNVVALGIKDSKFADRFRVRDLEQLQVGLLRHPRQRLVDLRPEDLDHALGRKNVAGASASREHRALRCDHFAEVSLHEDDAGRDVVGERLQ